MHAPHETAPDGLGAALDEMALATDRLLRTVDEMQDEDLPAPSLLPGWTRAHVLTHLARNADGLARLAGGARAGEVPEMYPGGREGREAEIQAGAGRHIGDVQLDLAESAERLLEAFADFPPDALQREVTLTSGATAYGWEIPLLRVREVEIHHVDLDLGYTPSDWSPEFAARTLDQISPVFRDARDCPVGVLTATDVEGTWEVGSSESRLTGSCTALAAWLTGRTAGEGLEIHPAGAVPPAPRWV